MIRIDVVVVGVSNSEVCRIRVGRDFAKGWIAVRVVDIKRAIGAEVDAAGGKDIYHALGERFGDRCPVQLFVAQVPDTGVTRVRSCFKNLRTYKNNDLGHHMQSI